MVVVASPSAFKNLFTLIQHNDLKLVCIGKTTANEVKEYGIEPLAVAKEPTARGITEAIIGYYQSGKHYH